MEKTISNRRRLSRSRSAEKREESPGKPTHSSHHSSHRHRHLSRHSSHSHRSRSRSRSKGERDSHKSEQKRTHHRDEKKNDLSRREGEDERKGELIDEAVTEQRSKRRRGDCSNGSTTGTLLAPAVSPTPRHPSIEQSVAPIAALSVPPAKSDSAKSTAETKALSPIGPSEPIAATATSGTDAGARTSTGTAEARGESQSLSSATTVTTAAAINRAAGADASSKTTVAFVPLHEHSAKVDPTAPAIPVALSKSASAAKTATMATSIPVFLTKKQRQELALQRLQEQREEEKKRSENERIAREQFIRIARTPTTHSTRSSHSTNSTRKDERRDRDTKERRDHSRAEDGAKERSPSTERPSPARDHQPITDIELEQIKQHYIGQKQVKRKMIQPSQKFRFSFDWEPEDDTTDRTNPLYRERADICLAYGRGYIAGVDRREQRSKRKFYDELLQRKKAEEADGRDGSPSASASSASGAPSYSSATVEVGRPAINRDDGETALTDTRHWSEKPLSEMSVRDWRIFKEDFSISTRGGNIPNPMRKWDEMELLDNIRLAIRDLGYDTPTPIQRQAIPIGLANRDIVGIAETGSGKTLSFVVPMLMYISRLPRLTQETALEGPYAIVLAPTRELAQQTADECEKFRKYTGIRTVSIVGGVSVEEQALQFRDGAEIIVATPGRLGDCLRARLMVLNQCNYAVLDEADRMIDLGFEPQVLEILNAMPSTNLRPENEEAEDAHKRYRQTIMFSATMPLKVELIARKYLRRPAFVSIGDASGKGVDRVEQVAELMKESHKRQRLSQVLASAKPPIIVFANSKKICDSLAKSLDNEGHRCALFHGGKIQEQREEALEAFKNGTCDLLIATDVAGRGIDVQGVTLVVNYDMPKEIDKYQHRIGRTGRAGLSGKAISFLTEDDSDIFFDLKAFLTNSHQKVPSELAHHEAAQSRPGTVAWKACKPSTIFAKNVGK